MHICSFTLFITREIFREEKQEEVKEKTRQVKQVKNKHLLSFGGDDDDDDDDDEEGGSMKRKPSRIVSFQEASGLVKKEELKTVDVSAGERRKSDKENPWVQKLKDKIRAQMKEEALATGEMVPPSSSSSSTTASTQQMKGEEGSMDTPTTDEDIREKVKSKIREMKKKSKEVGL